MSQIKIGNQIAFLRKQKNMTQDALASVLNVSGQAVSRWESGACCPDLQLIPMLSDYFDVSVDFLLGIQKPRTPQDLALDLKDSILSTEHRTDAALVMSYASTLHAALLSKQPEMKNRMPDESTEQKKSDKKGVRYSCLNIPEITSLKRNGVMLFSDNQNLPLSDRNMLDITRTMKMFADLHTLQILFALYALTVDDEEHYISAADIAQKASLPEKAITEVLHDRLFPILSQKTADETILYRIAGPYMSYPPILSLIAGPYMSYTPMLTLLTNH